MPTPSWPRLCGHWLADQLERADPGQVWRLRPFGSRGRAGGKLGTSARHGSRPTSVVSAGPLARGLHKAGFFGAVGYRVLLTRLIVQRAGPGVSRSA
jgi:hypothetical protein